MKAQHLYRELKEVAERLGIQVREQNLRSGGIQSSGGLCKVRGQEMFFIDKRQTIHTKVRRLAECLAQRPIEEIYIVPAVREEIRRHRETRRRLSRKRAEGIDAPRLR